MRGSYNELRSRTLKRPPPLSKKKKKNIFFLSLTMKKKKNIFFFFFSSVYEGRNVFFCFWYSRSENSGLRPRYGAHRLGCWMCETYMNIFQLETPLHALVTCPILSHVRDEVLRKCGLSRQPQ